MNANLRNFALWVIIVLLLLALFTVLQNGGGQRTQSTEISFSQLLNEVDKERVKEVVIQGPEIHGTFTDGRQFQTYSPNDPSLIQRLYNKGVAITARPLSDNVPWFLQLLISWLPFIALIGVWIFLSRQMQGAGGKALGFGKSRAKLLTEAIGRVTSRTSPASTRPSRTCRRSSNSCATPASSSGSAGASRAACFSSARPVPARRCSRARSRARRTCRSSRSRAPTSSRCSSAWARAAYATCSSRRRRTR